MEVEIKYIKIKSHLDMPVRISVTRGGRDDEAALFSLRGIVQWTDGRASRERQGRAAEIDER
jgi:hypothetical protein